MANNPQFSGFQPPRPPIAGSADPSRSFLQPVPSWQGVPAQQPQQYVSLPLQFQPTAHIAPPMNTGLPSIPQQPQFTSSAQHLPPRPGHTIQNGLPSSALPISQSSNPIASESALPQPVPPGPSNFVPAAVIGPGATLSSSYTFSSQGVQAQHQMNFTAPRPPTHFPQMPQANTLNVSSGEQPRVLSESQSILQQSSEQASVSTNAPPGTNIQPKGNGVVHVDWIEHTSSASGRRYYYNRKTKQSSWQKPFELMTEIERADATTNWKEYKSPDGRLYYYNEVTKQSKWVMPEELKIAREQLIKGYDSEAQSEKPVSSVSADSTSLPEIKAPNVAEASPSVVEGAVVPSPLPVASSDNAAPDPEPERQSFSIGNAANDTEPATLSVSVDEKAKDDPNEAASDALETTEVGASETPEVRALETAEVAASVDEVAVLMTDNSSTIVAQDIPSPADGPPAPDKESVEDEAPAPKSDKSLEDKLVNPEPQYPTKLEAKDAFKGLLEASNVGSDWTWERAMRVVINDKRYGALKTLGERKEAFNEFILQRKKLEVEERRLKQKKMREDFWKMLEECEELTSNSRWSKVGILFEDDERFKAVERERDRKDLFEDFIRELEKKERAKAVEDRKRNIMEYRHFLQSCDFITANSQWRKVQDRLEADERCSRLEKIDRVDIFQEHLRNLEKEEEEQRKIQKEELRKVERKHRDEFHKLMEEHVASGILTVKTVWRDYHLKVENLPAYMAVASNTSGSTPKELFEDLHEELIKQYQEDKNAIENATKSRKVSLSGSSTIEELKTALADDLSSLRISDANLKLVFDEMLVSIQRKEEKEAKKKKRLGDKFFGLLQSIREITANSTWEDSKHLFENSHDFSSKKDENFQKEIFGEYITALKEQEKEYERRRKEEKAAEREKERLRKDRKRSRDRRDKERGDEGEAPRDDGGNSDISGEKRRSSNKDRDNSSSRRHHRRHHDAPTTDTIDNERDRSRRSHNNNRHGSDHRKRTQSPESDGERRNKRHRRDHRNGSSRRSSGVHEELEDGEFGI